MEAGRCPEIRFFFSFWRVVLVGVGVGGVEEIFWSWETVVTDRPEGSEKKKKKKSEPPALRREAHHVKIGWVVLMQCH